MGELRHHPQKASPLLLTMTMRRLILRIMAMEHTPGPSLVRLTQIMFDITR